MQRNAPQQRKQNNSRNRRRRGRRSGNGGNPNPSTPTPPRTLRQRDTTDTILWTGAVTANSARGIVAPQTIGFAGGQVDLREIWRVHSVAMRFRIPQGMDGNTARDNGDIVFATGGRWTQWVPRRQTAPHLQTVTGQWQINIQTNRDRDTTVTSHYEVRIIGVRERPHVHHITGAHANRLTFP